MTEQPAVPEPTEIETVAQLAAQAAARALPDYGPRVQALEESVGQILAALSAAASPEGNAARLAARLESVEQGIAKLSAVPQTLPPAAQKILDDLRLKVANLERTNP